MSNQMKPKNCIWVVSHILSEQSKFLYFMFFLQLQIYILKNNPIT